MKALWAAAGLLLGCATVPPQVGAPPPEVHGDRSEQRYQETLARFTDHSEIYLGMDTVMFADATFQAMPFREARVRRQASFQEWPEAKLQQTLEEEKAEEQKSNTFFFGEHVADYHWDDFDRSNSIWRIALVTPTGEFTPTKVLRIGRSSLDMRAYYPYMGDFFVAYEIDFPKTDEKGQPVVPPDAQTVTLKVASTLGKAEFKVAAH